jgi:hypothetical protein
MGEDWDESENPYLNPSLREVQPYLDCTLRLTVLLHWWYRPVIE